VSGDNEPKVTSVNLGAPCASVVNNNRVILTVALTLTPSLTPAFPTRPLIP